MGRPSRRQGSLVSHLKCLAWCHAHHSWDAVHHHHCHLQRDTWSDSSGDQIYWLGYLSAPIWGQRTMTVTLLQRLVREISPDSSISVSCREDKWFDGQSWIWVLLFINIRTYLLSALKYCVRHSGKVFWILRKKTHPRVSSMWQVGIEVP